MTNKQDRMWETEDLPLLSGTPINDYSQPFLPQAYAHQKRMVDGCPCCLGTGQYAGFPDGYCYCEIGLKAKQEAKR